VVETPNANLVAGMRWFLSAYTIRLNRRQKLFGHVFSGRYKALIVDGSGNGYLKTACDYVHLNPARAHLLGQDDRLLAYPWSSFCWYLAAPEHRPKWIRVDRLLGEHGIQQDSVAGRQQFEQQMETRRLEETDEEQFKPLRRGWCLGSEQFRQKMLEIMEGKLGESHSGELRRETAEQKANRIISEELARLGWKESDLAVRMKTDPGKLALAARPRNETTLPIRWIAARVQIGTPKGARSVLHHWAHAQDKPASAPKSK
jgi:putative transposase